ncbi:YceD family protein [Alkalicoccus daliensis]|uniref:DUF177 domain-containing protein n=1 Tax=Alkalicoccus daliensis TaxID=745820 RepID=A0A1G9ZU01_9BACI|nr:YceD family protein [Alkalicoccus daliensis]SDN24597.1 uncharacterized protein SAMN04488053_101233 [Alkalicoccus daliensis]
MKWSIQQLQSFKNDGVLLDESVDVSEVKQVDREIRDISTVKVKGSGSISRDLATFHLKIEGTMTLPCARTLNDVEFPFAIDAIEAFQLSEGATFDEEDEVHELTSNTVDLLPFVQERILLEKPFRVFSEKSEGPAPHSGNGWKMQAEDADADQKKQVDPRLAKLENLFKKDE